MENKEEFEMCLIMGFQNCMDNPKNKEDPNYHVAKKCQLSCKEKETKSALDLGVCLATCFIHEAKNLKFGKYSLSLSL